MPFIKVERSSPVPPTQASSPHTATLQQTERNTASTGTTSITQARGPPGVTLQTQPVSEAYQPNFADTALSQQNQKFVQLQAELDLLRASIERAEVRLRSMDTIYGASITAVEALRSS